MKTAKTTLFATALLGGVAVASFSASALTVEEVTAKYTDLGYRVLEVDLSRRGRVIEITAVLDGVEVEIKVDAETGDVLEIETVGDTIAERDREAAEAATEREREAAKDAAEAEREAAKDAAEREREAAEGPSDSDSVSDSDSDSDSDDPPPPAA